MVSESDIPNLRKEGVPSDFIDSFNMKDNDLSPHNTTGNFFTTKKVED